MGKNGINNYSILEININIINQRISPLFNVIIIKFYKFFSCLNRYSIKHHVFICEVERFYLQEKKGENLF